MVVVTKKKEAENNNLKPKFSKCSKLKRAISHKILGKAVAKPLPSKSNKGSVLLLSMINTGEQKITSKAENRSSSNFSNENFEEKHLQKSLDLVIQEAKHQLWLENLQDKRSSQLSLTQAYNSHGKFSTRPSNSYVDEEDIYEEMDVLQSYFETIYNGDYLEMGLV